MAKKISKATQAILDQMDRDAAATPAPTELTLKRLRDRLAEYRGLLMEKQALSERLTDINIKLNSFEFTELPKEFDDVGVDYLGIPAAGNLPGVEVQIKPYYHANIPDDKVSEAVAWFRKNKHGDLLKSTVTMGFGRGQDKMFKAFEKFAKANKIQFGVKFGVPWNTLTAWLKEQVEGEKPLPPLDVIGGKVGRVAKIKIEKVK